MNAEIFAEWLKRQGHQIYRTASSYWYNAGPKVLQAFPYHWLISPEKDEIHTLMLKHGIVALRYSSPSDSLTGKLSYHFVLQKCYDLNTLNNKARNGVKRGLNCFKVVQVSFERLAKEGWILQQDTLLRQNRSGSMNQKEWEQLCLSAQSLPGFEAFAAVSGDEMAAAVIVCRIDNIFSVPYAISHCRFLRNHVNNALFFSFCCDLLKRNNVNGIFFNVQSLDAPSNVDEFKLRMGFEPKIIRQNVVIHPFIKPFISSSIHSLSRRLLQRYPSNYQIAKAEGIMRFYLEGKRPIKEQTWPECLKVHKLF